MLRACFTSMAHFVARSRSSMYWLLCIPLHVARSANATYLHRSPRSYLPHSASVAPPSQAATSRSTRQESLNNLHFFASPPRISNQTSRSRVGQSFIHQSWQTQKAVPTSTFHRRHYQSSTCHGTSRKTQPLPLRARTHPLNRRHHQRLTAQLTAGLLVVQWLKREQRHQSQCQAR